MLTKLRKNIKGLVIMQLAFTIVMLAAALALLNKMGQRAIVAKMEKATLWSNENDGFGTGLQYAENPWIHDDLNITDDSEETLMVDANEFTYTTGGGTHSPGTKEVEGVQ